MSRRRILLVDDDEAVLTYLRAKLGARYDLLTTREPHDVLEMAREGRPDLILCDIDMPGMDGGDVSAALYADDTTRAIPVLFLSALLPESGQVGGRHAVSKNAPVEELVKRIDGLLG